MKAETRTLQEILRGDRCFSIPSYQRPYVWDEQWEPLWEDIESTARRLGDIREKGHAAGDHVAKSDQRAVPHFLGAIVVEQQATAVGEVDIRSVVDGQQRLTTLQLVLRGVLDALEGKAIKGQLVARLRRLTRNDDDVTSGQSLFKVIPQPAARTSYFSAMKAEPPPAHESSFAQARRFFAKCATEFLEEPSVPCDPYADGDEGHRRASLLAATLLSLLKMVVIDLEDVDDAQVIFEALNARGTPLSATDLVKNLLFMRAERQTSDAQRLYDEHWSRFDEDSDWWRETVGIGHAQRARQDWLLGDWLIAETGSVLSVGRLYSEFRAWLDRSEREVSQALEDLTSYADAYEQILGRKDGTSERERAAYQNIRALNISAATPVLLWLMVQPPDRLDAAEREVAFRAIEAYVVRRMAAKWQTRGYGQVFVDVLKSAQAATSHPGLAVVKALKSGPHGYTWPSDEDLRECFRTGRYYGPGGINRGRMILLLREVDRYLWAQQSMTERVAVDYGDLTVEHLMPQKWRKHWPLPEGDDAERLRAEQTRNERIHCIGNLTLVTGKLNPALSNAAWGAKRDGLGAHSVLRLNQLLCEQATWDTQAIERRGEWLAGQLGHVWPDADHGPWADGER
ncbi:MAG: DUF262 domain-containing protein [Myxococcales bacterium]|nr:DUF262 domain-containing protein [Myxococcales bacterium]